MSTKTPLPVASSPPTAKPPESGRHLALEITGMTCASCVRRVERALEEVPGVAAATVNLAAASADVAFAQPVEPGADHRRDRRRVPGGCDLGGVGSAERVLGDRYVTRRWAAET
jgi:copper chaperone CopZ